MIKKSTRNVVAVDIVPVPYCEVGATGNHLATQVDAPQAGFPTSRARRSDSAAHGSVAIGRGRSPESARLRLIDHPNQPDCLLLVHRGQRTPPPKYEAPTVYLTLKYRELFVTISTGMTV